jgi:hypothetical protein
MHEKRENVSNEILITVRYVKKLIVSVKVRQSLRFAFEFRGSFVITSNDRISNRLPARNTFSPRQEIFERKLDRSEKLLLHQWPCTFHMFKVIGNEAQKLHANQTCMLAGWIREWSQVDLVIFTASRSTTHLYEELPPLLKASRLLSSPICFLTKIFPNNLGKKFATWNAPKEPLPNLHPPPLWSYLWGKQI